MLHGIAAVPQVADGKQRCQRRAFVVIHATADHHIMGGEVGSPIGRVYPPVTLGHHIQMGDHADAVLRVAPAQGRGIALMIDHIKAEGPTPGHGYIEHLQAIRPERHARRGQIRPAHRGNAGPGLQLLNQFPAMILHPFGGILHQMRVLLFIPFHCSYPPSALPVRRVWGPVRTLISVCSANSTFPSSIPSSKGINGHFCAECGFFCEEMRILAVIRFK